MTTIIFVRHGQSETNIHNQFAGQFDTTLTEKGVLQAELLSQWVIKNYRIDKIFTSDLSRAYNTALPFANKSGINVYKSAELREINAGNWNGKKYIDIMKEYPKEYHVWKNNISEASLPEGESVKKFSKRIEAEVRRIADMHPNQTIMIVTHAVVIRIIMAIFKKGDISKAAEVSWVPNASVTVANYENSRMKFEIVGFDGYLKDMKSNLPSDIV